MGVDPDELEFVAQKLERSGTPLSAQIVRDAAAKITRLRQELADLRAQRTVAAGEAQLMDAKAAEYGLTSLKDKVMAFGAAARQSPHTDSGNDFVLAHLVRVLWALDALEAGPDPETGRDEILEQALREAQEGC